MNLSRVTRKQNQSYDHNTTMCNIKIYKFERVIANMVFKISRTPTKLSPSLGWGGVLTQPSNPEYNGRYFIIMREALDSIKF